MSSSIPDMGPLRAPQGLHLVLAVGVSALFWNLAAFWVTGASPSWPSAPLGLLYAVVLGFWAPWRQRTHQGPLLKFWLWLVMTLLLYATLALIEGKPWPETFTLGGFHLLWFALGFLQGQLTALWAGQLAPRARLYHLIVGLPSGRLLEERVRDFQLDADFSKANEAALSGSLIVLATLTVLLATFSPFGRDGLSPFLAAGFLVVCLLVGVLLRVYRREMEALMYGRRFSLAEKVAPLGWSLLLLGGAALGASGLMLLGGPWVDWNALLQGRHEPVLLETPPLEPQEPPPASTRGSDYTLTVLLALLQNIFRVRQLLAVLQGFFQLAAWLTPWGIAAFLLWPLIRWVLSGGRETKGLARRWWSLLVDQWRTFWAQFLTWWRKPLTSETDVTEASTPREWLRSLFRRPASRRAPYPAVVEAFLTLVRWAEPVTVYRRGETTREYLDRLALLLSEHQVTLIEVRDLLDRELFGPRGLDAEGRRLFLGQVARLTASPPSHETTPGVS